MHIDTQIIPQKRGKAPYSYVFYVSDDCIYIPPFSFVRGQDSTMWDIVWISPQEHRSVSVRCQAVRERQQRVKSKATTTFANASSPICHMNLAICCRRSRIAHNMSSLYGYLNTLLAAVDDWSAGVKLPLLTTLTESL